MPPLLPTLCFVDTLPHAVLCLLACSGGSKLTYLELPFGEAWNWAWRQSLPLRWLQPVRLPESGTQLSHTYISFSIETNIINAIVCSQKVSGDLLHSNGSLLPLLIEVARLDNGDTEFGKRMAYIFVSVWATNQTESLRQMFCIYCLQSLQQPGKGGVVHIFWIDWDYEDSLIWLKTLSQKVTEMREKPKSLLFGNLCSFLCINDS